MRLRATRLISSGRGRTVWTPAYLRTTLWLDAADANTITLNGSNVSQWNDKSGNGSHAAQANAALQPVYSETGLNSLPCITFNQKYLSNAVSSLPLIERSCFIVADETTRVAASGLLSVSSIAGSSDFNSTTGCSFDTGSSAQLTQFQIVGSTSTSYRLAPGPNIATRGVFGEVKSAGSGTLYKDGTSVATDTVFTEFSANSAGGYVIGARMLNTGIDYTTLGLRGNIAEIVYLPAALSTLDRQRMEGYLAWKWGFVSNLPASHPYKNAPPTI